MGVVDEVSQRALERAPVAADEGVTVGLDGDRGIAGRRVARELRQVDCLVRDAARVLARQREEVVEQAAQALGVGMDVGQRLGIGAMGLQIRRVSAQRRDRIPQLVRRVRDKAALGLAGLLERGEHAVQRLGQAVYLVGTRLPAARQTERRVAGPLDHGRALRQPLERPQRAACEEQRERERERGREEGASDDQPPRLLERVLDVILGCGDDHRAAARGPTQIGEGRDVHPDLVAAQVRAAVAPVAARDRRGDPPSGGDCPALQAERPRHDPAVPVDDLDVDQARPGRDVEHPCRGQEGRCGGVDLRDLGRALAERRVQLGVEVVREQDLHAGPEHRHRDDDRAGRSERHAHPQRPAAARTLRSRHRRRT